MTAQRSPHRQNLFYELASPLRSKSWISIARCFSWRPMTLRCARPPWWWGCSSGSAENVDRGDVEWAWTLWTRIGRRERSRRL
jgi:hypothetical protein